MAAVNISIMKGNYYEDISIFNSRAGRIWSSLLIPGLILFPFMTTSYPIYIANIICINIIVAAGLYLLVGVTGQISLGHSGFMAIGAYTTVILMKKAGLPFLISLPAAGLTAAAFGFLLGLPSLRLEGPYLSIATLGFGMTITKVIGKLSWLGGREGLHAPTLTLGPWMIDTDKTFYFPLIIITALLLSMMRNLMATRFGRAFAAIRDTEIAAQALGVNLFFFKTLSFAVSAFYAGIAGGLYAFVLRFIEPEIFSLMMSILFLAMVVVGGTGSLGGTVIGAVLLTLLDFQLGNILNIPWLGRWMESISISWFSLNGISNIQFILFGGIMAGIMVFEPMGLAGILKRLKTYWQRRHL